jgi:hypothetical protein
VLAFTVIISLASTLLFGSIDRQMEDMPHAEFFPAAGRMDIDPDGNVWVAEYRQTGDPGPTPYDVFSSAGIWLGSVPVPQNFRPTQIGQNHLVGVWEDDLEVEQVRVYELIKP